MKHSSKALDILYSDDIKPKRFEEKNIKYISPKDIGTDFSYKHQIVWKNAVSIMAFNFFALWGVYLLFTGRVQFISILWVFCLMYSHGTGITVGAHRLFTHKSFKATPLLKAILIAMQTGAGQNNLFIWCRDHRLHHRYSDTDADPHNAERGFFFSHMGWLMVKKHPQILKLGKNIDMSDLQNDWMITFQKKYYIPMYVILGIIIPIGVPVYFFNEDLWTSVLFCYFSTYTITLHSTWLVNSAAHLYGIRPYDQNLRPVECWFVSMITFGEGWHNYHHVYPWDYKTAELGMPFNPSARLIRLFERMGLAYDLKTVSQEMVEKRILRTGDGTHYMLGNEEAISSATVIGPLHPKNQSHTMKKTP